VYWEKDNEDSWLSEEFGDSTLILANIALTYDDQLPEAYWLRGRYYILRGNPDQAIREYDKTISYNPNDHRAYSQRSDVYAYQGNLVGTISSRHKAVSLNPHAGIGNLQNLLGQAFGLAGFDEKYKYYIQESLNINNDTAAFYFHLGISEFYLANFEKAAEYAEIAIDLGYIANDFHIRLLIDIYVILGRYDDLIQIYEEYLDRTNSPIESARFVSKDLGYAYWKLGYKDKAEYYFNGMINRSERILELERPPIIKVLIHGGLGGVYAFKGQKAKAYEHLNSFNQGPRMTIEEIIFIKNFPLFDSIRDEPEFQQIARDVEAKYQAEHERVRQWMEENDML
jgi:tetratricopeptide (TPR) repeat protein